MNRSKLYKAEVKEKGDITEKLVYEKGLRYGT